MLKLLTSALLVFGATSAAHADRDVRDSRAERFHARNQLAAAEVAQRAAAARVDRAADELRDSERALRTAQIQLDRTTAQLNRAVRMHRPQRARLLARKLDRLTARASDAEMRRDESRARLAVARADYQRSKDDLYQAASRAGVITNRG